ncbi:unnamed protein product [Prorocentrum cordatum]|uniref:Uncharacterized protein n=1 Tax=Prorocentrum cordatum TaxID=2364126 RepID=A0ABN9VZ18_9DINO|nr:unnamed protein product [Polarella glacialis]
MAPAPWRIPDDAEETWTRQPWIRVPPGGAKAGQNRGDRLYTVCSCGHWTWNDLLAKRHNLCVGCQSQCHPLSSSVGGGGQMLLYTGAEESGWGEGGSKSKGRWRKGTQAQQEAASHLAPDLTQKLLAQFVPKPPPQPQATPQAECQRASQAKKASKEKLDKALARRAALDKEVSDLDKHIDELMARDLENADILEQATRKLAVGVLKPAEPISSKNVISFDALFKDSADEIKHDFGEELDVSGPAFSAEDREGFEKFKLEQPQQVKTLLHGALTSIKSQYRTHQEEYQKRMGEPRKKRKTTDGAVATGVAASQGAGSQSAASSQAPAADAPKAVPAAAEAPAEPTDKEKKIEKARADTLARAKAAAARAKAEARESGP